MSLSKEFKVIFMKEYLAGAVPREILNKYEKKNNAVLKCINTHEQPHCY